ncbi:hypothetical protein M153_3280004122 [Pseudoloma neurophilia]|uniref:Uncharacterized protein n=1 Tax=Pseudoloma neurophilia TaxID=146866 RepID=A0A0R0LY25_9MICR|nr:hypothetical protein M153_3280004122 [Pseudoloma neurophilia]
MKDNCDIFHGHYRRFINQIDYVIYDKSYQYDNFRNQNRLEIITDKSFLLNLIDIF